MKTSYLAHAFAATLTLTTLVSCGGSNKTGGGATTLTGPKTQDEHEGLDGAIENSRISRELLGAKLKDRGSSEVEVLRDQDGISVFIVGRYFQIDESFARKLNELSASDKLRLIIHVDELIVSSSVRAASGEIELIGEEITFLNDALFDVSGVDGNDGGEIYYEYGKVKEEGPSMYRFLLNGGDGVPSHGGKNGQDGRSVGVLKSDIVYSIENRLICPLNPDWDGECAKNQYVSGSKVCSTSGTDAIAPTRPGRGGRRGSFLLKEDFTSDLATLIYAKNGENAADSVAFRGGKGGSPTRARFEYINSKYEGGGYEQKKVHYEECPTVKDGASVPAMSADNSFREELPWGKTQKRAESLGYLKRLNFNLQEQMASLASLQFESLDKSFTQSLNYFQHVIPREVRTILLFESLQNQYSLIKTFASFIQNNSFYERRVTLGTLREYALLYIGIGSEQVIDKENDFFGHLGMIEPELTLAVETSASIPHDLQERISEVILYSQNLTEAYDNFLNISKDERKELLPRYWKSLSLPSTHLDSLLKGIEKYSSENLRLVSYQTLMSMISLLEKRHLLYLMAYGTEVEVQKFKKQVLRKRLMISFQQLGHKLLKDGAFVPEDFIYSIDMSLIKSSQVIGSDVELYEIENMAARLIEPALSYAQ